MLEHEGRVGLEPTYNPLRREDLAARSPALVFEATELCRQWGRTAPILG